MEAHRVPQGQGGLLPLASALVSCPAKPCHEDAWGGHDLSAPPGATNQSQSVRQRASDRVRVAFCCHAVEAAAGHR